MSQLTCEVNSYDDSVDEIIKSNTYCKITPMFWPSEDWIKEGVAVGELGKVVRVGVKKDFSQN